jgi:hypothetical protein
LGKFFEMKPLKGKARFSHYRPARYLVENVSKLAKLIPAETLDRFEAAFRQLNSLIG